MVMVLLLDRERERVLLSFFFLKELLGLFRYPLGSGRALLAGTLPLRYSAARFANRTPTWRLPVFGHVFGLAAAGVVQEAFADGRQEVHWVSGSEPGRKRIRQNRKNTLHTSLVSWVHIVHVCGRGCVDVGHSSVSFPDPKRRLCDQDDEGYVPDQVRIGVGVTPWVCAGPRLQVCTFFFKLALICVRNTNNNITNKTNQPTNQRTQPTNHTTPHHTTPHHTTPHHTTPHQPTNQTKPNQTNKPNQTKPNQQTNQPTNQQINNSTNQSTNQQTNKPNQPHQPNQTKPNQPNQRKPTKPNNQPTNQTTRRVSQEFSFFSWHFSRWIPAGSP